MAQGPVMFMPRDAKYTYGEPSKQQHIEAYCKAKSSEWEEDLSKDEYAAVRAYGTSQYYQEINDCARGREPCGGARDIAADYPPGSSPAYKYVNSGEASNSLQRSLDRQRVTEDTVVYRAVTKSRLEKMQAGDHFQDDGFMSTTMNPAVAGTWRNGDEPVVEIRVPKGTKGGYMQNMAMYDNEVELLLQRGTQVAFSGKTKTVKMPSDTGGGWRERTVYVFDVVGQEDLPMALTEVAKMLSEAKPRERKKDDRLVRPERFAWEDGDLQPIDKSDVVPIKEPEEPEEE